MQRELQTNTMVSTYYKMGFISQMLMFRQYLYQLQSKALVHLKRFLFFEYLVSVLSTFLILQSNFSLKLDKSLLMKLIKKLRLGDLHDKPFISYFIASLCRGDQI